MKRNLFRLRTKYSIQESMMRLTDVVDRGTTFMLHDLSRFVRGHIRDNSIIIRKNITYRNSFQKYLHASLHETEHETILDCRIRYSILLYIFMCMYMIVIILLTVVWCAATYPRIEMYIGAFLPLALLIPGLVMKIYETQYGYKEAAFLKSFIMDVLEADDVIE